MPDTLETVDLRDVEILRTGGPIHGRLSPPQGDTYTTADLRELAAANAALAGEIRPVATIGHDRDGPAVGRLERIRVSPDGSRLLTDIVGMPRKFSELVTSKAYGSRSLELSRIVSQSTGRTYERVVSALAFLGGAMPAVHGLRDVGDLGDVVALYELAERQPQRMYAVVFSDPNDAADDEYQRDFEARFERAPFFAQSASATDPEAAEIATRLGMNLEEVI